MSGETDEDDDMPRLRELLFPVPSRPGRFSKISDLGLWGSGDIRLRERKKNIFDA